MEFGSSPAKMTVCDSAITQSRHWRNCGKRQESPAMLPSKISLVALPPTQTPHHTRPAAYRLRTRAFRRSRFRAGRVSGLAGQSG
jgi:hypothetical protein